jgi:arylsulfatase A-like enzyme
MHRDHGMLIMNGPNVQPGSVLQGASVYDIAPTVLHVMGLPVPADMDGHVLAGAFADGYLTAFPVEIADRGSVASAEGSPTVDYTADGEKEIVERLKGLGYLG